VVPIDDAEAEDEEVRAIGQRQYVLVGWRAERLALALIQLDDRRRAGGGAIRTGRRDRDGDAQNREHAREKPVFGVDCRHRILKRMARFLEVIRARPLGSYMLFENYPAAPLESQRQAADSCWGVTKDRHPSDLP
jgi:hypothetical protein